jgi:hypothetical protein
LWFKNNRINHRKHKRHKNEDIRKFCDTCAFCGLKKNIINRHFHFGQNSFAPAEEEIVD